MNPDLKQRATHRLEMGTLHFSENSSPLHFGFLVFPAVLENSRKIMVQGIEVIQDMDNCQNTGRMENKYGKGSNMSLRVIFLSLLDMGTLFARNASILRKTPNLCES